MTTALIRVQKDVDMVELERLCNNFHEQFRERRSNCDDGGMALKVLEDMRSDGVLSPKTEKRLFH